MQQITNFEEVVYELQGKLEQYLEDHLINTMGQFSCLNPEHTDKKPSCGLVPGKRRWNCFGCGTRGDIFDAAHFLEKKPLQGGFYISETVIPLAQRYGIEVKERELTPEESRRVDTYNAYKKAADYISTHPTEAAIDEMKRRGWSPAICSERSIGSVDSNRGFMDYMLGLGYTSKFLDEIDLIRENLFSPFNLIFTVCDEKGRPCGFAAKNLRFGLNGETGPKYINSRNTDTDAKCNIYDKGRRLYNIHHARRGTGSLYIFEGYGDVETAVQKGLDRVTCIGGTAFTEQHILELKKLGIIDVILCLDGDKAGLDKTNKIVDMFARHREFRVQVVYIPEEMDPDDYIRAHDIEKFKELKKHTAFEWILNQYDDRTDPVQLSEQMIPIIAAESSSRMREELAGVLAKRVPYSKNAILDDVEKLINEEDEENSGKRKIILDTMMLNLKQYPADWRISVNNAVGELEIIEQEYHEESFSSESYMKDVQEMKLYEEKNNDSVKGYDLGDWALIQNALNGDWDSTMCMVGGSANTGKTGWLANLALRLVQNNKDKNVMVLFQSIDDTLNQFTNRIVCLLAQKHWSQVTLNMIKNPNGLSQQTQIHRARNKAYEEFNQLIADGRFVVRGGEQRGGNTTKFTDDWIKYNKKRYPDRKIIFFLDNFHRLRDFMGMKDERARFKLLSNTIKDIAKVHNIPVWVSVEYVKTAGLERPNNTNISESVAMEYDGNFIMHLYNELHARRDDAIRYIESVDANNQPIRFPTVEGIVGKNKITEFKGSLFWDFYTNQSRFVQVSQQVVQERESAKRMRAKEDNNDRNPGYGTGPGDRYAQSSSNMSRFN